MVLLFPLCRFARMASSQHPALAPPAGRGAGGEGKASQSFQVPPCLIGCLAEACQKGKTAGGSPAVKTAGGSPITTSPGVARRQVPFFASPKKGTKERRPHLRWPSASRSRQAQAGQCGNSLRFEFQRKRSSNIRIAFTVDPAVCGSFRGGVQVQRQSRNTPGLPRPCGPRNDVSVASMSLRATRSNPVRASAKLIPLSPLPACGERVARRAG